MVHILFALKGVFPEDLEPTLIKGIKGACSTSGKNSNPSGMMKLQNNLNQN